MARSRSYSAIAGETAEYKRDSPSLGNGLDRRAKTLVGVLSVSTLIEGMVDVLVVVTALELVHVGEAGVGWLNGAWGVGAWPAGCSPSGSRATGCRWAAC